MDYSGSMSFRQTVGYLLKIPQQFPNLGSVSIDRLAKRRAVHLLHGYEVCAFMLANLIDVGNVWVI